MNAVNAEQQQAVQMQVLGQQPANPLIVVHPGPGPSPTELPNLAAAAQPAGGRSCPAWQPYESQWTETPFHKVMRSFPRGWYRWRWTVTYPLQVRPLSWLPMTLGELLVMLAALGAAGGAMGGTWKNATGSGTAASIPLFLTLMFATHNSVWTFLFGIPFERALFWHGFTACLTVAMGLYHGLSSWRYGYTKNDVQVIGPTAGDWMLPITDEYFITGIGLLGAMVLLLSTSLLPQLRRWLFQSWLYLHMALVVATIGFAFAHDATLIAIGVIFWILDLLVRFVFMAALRHPRQVELVALPGDVVRISWPKEDFQYSGGQYCFICIPALSLFEWHPFSISSHPGQDQVLLHARILGDWTRALYKLAASSGFTGQPLVTRAFIEGPYGSPAVDISGLRYDMFLLISGGIGVTPMQSMMNDLLSQYARGRDIKFLWFVWSVRDKHMLSTVLDYDIKYAQREVPGDLPLSFSPNLVSPSTTASSWTGSPSAASEILKTEFYLTQARDTSEYPTGNIDPQRQAALRLGRPKLPEIFKDMARVAAAKQPKDPRVAVLVCGPQGMIDEVTRLCSGGPIVSEGTRVRFDVHAESFNL